MHASDFQDGDETYKDKNVVVVGAACSGHDVAVACYRHAAKVTMLQRSPIFVTSLKTSQELLVQRWNKDTVGPTDSVDSPHMSTHRQLFRSSHQTILIS